MTKMERKSEDELEEVQRPGGGRLMQSEFNKGAAYARDCISQNYGEMHAQFKG